MEEELTIEQELDGKEVEVLVLVGNPETRKIEVKGEYHYKSLDEAKEHLGIINLIFTAKGFSFVIVVGEEGAERTANYDNHWRYNV